MITHQHCSSPLACLYFPLAIDKSNSDTRNKVLVSITLYQGGAILPKLSLRLRRSNRYALESLRTPCFISVHEKLSKRRYIDINRRSNYWTHNPINRYLH